MWLYEVYQNNLHFVSFIFLFYFLFYIDNEY